MFLSRCLINVVLSLLMTSLMAARARAEEIPADRLFLFRSPELLEACKDAPKTGGVVIFPQSEKAHVGESFWGRANSCWESTKVTGTREAMSSVNLNIRH